MYKNIINPVTGKKVSIFSKIGKNILNNYMNQIGSGKCSICHSVGTTKATCPLNNKAKHPNASKHPKANSGWEKIKSKPKANKTATSITREFPLIAEPQSELAEPQSELLTVFTLQSSIPMYKGPPPPKFNNISGLASIVYYDLSVNGKRKRILFASEYHEFPYDDKLFSYIHNLSNWIRNRTTKRRCLDWRCLDWIKTKKTKKKGCLDIHAEIYHKWTPTSKLNFGNQFGKGIISNLENINVNFHNFAGKKAVIYENVRYHKDDARGYNSMYMIDYTDKHFNFNILEMIALGIGLGPHSEGGKPLISLKKRWDKIDGMFRKQTWEMLSLSRNRFRKSMILFMREYKISQKKIYDAIVKSFRFSTRGATFNFGWEALYDIYSFFRMFRTFDKKRIKPCPEGTQNNIINISHFGHAVGIWFLIYNIFGILPNYIENIPFVEKAITDFFKNIHQIHYLDRPTGDVPKIIHPLGKSTTPLFFN